MNGIGPMLLVLPTIWFSKFVEWTPNRIQYVQIAFTIVQALVICVLLYIYRVINRKAEAKMISVPLPPSSPFASSQGTESLSIMDYDLKEWRALFFQGTLMQLLILGFLSYKFSTVIPLLSQVYMSPFRLWGQNLFQIHVLNRHVNRPFPPPASFWSSFSNAPRPTTTTIQRSLTD